MGDAYNHWFHCTCQTYGAWLMGDPRGFRTRHHRMHVEGDYKNPPPKGTWDEVHKRSRELMTRRPVVLSKPQREIVIESVVVSLQKRRVEVLAVAMDRIHLHLLARFPNYDARDLLGIAKRESWNALRLRGHPFDGGIWGKRSRNLPIHDRSHQVEAFWYILRHKFRSAEVWCYDPTKLLSLTDRSPRPKRNPRSSLRGLRLDHD